MSRLVSRAESWEKVYTAFANINFSAFDYNTVKQSILDYIKLYFPETFNDFIESSELIAIIESFAYIAEILAYRVDVVAHENFITTAQRRDSIIKLAKLISYKVSRPLPARGLVKITSVSTTETIIDANGINLSGRTIRWNDQTNTSWKDQFTLVVNRILDQEFGSVVASDRFQIQDVLFEIYPTVTTTGVIPYSASVYGQSINMELVPVAKSTGDVFTGTVSGIVERRPQQNAQFTILYGSDGLGDASETTGFFCFTKQGTLQRFRTTFDGITPNMTYDVPASNVNDTDVWVNNIDPMTGDIIVKTSYLPYRRETVEGKYGEWVEVDIAHAQNVIFNTNPKRNKYEVETVGNDNRVRILFGDGEFADVPSGVFDVWVRTSINDDIVVPQSSVVDIPVSFTYVDTYNQSQTFTFTISLIGSLQNASAAETTEHVRQTAPSVYYTQDRMVNGEDYNVYMRQNPTILKLRAINRTFAGDSKYITWHDSSNTYENVKMFGDDGIMYYKDTTITTATLTPVETNVLISTYIEPLLTSTDVFMQLVTAGVDHTLVRRVFSNGEKQRITLALEPPPDLRSIDLYFNTFNYQWYAVKTSASVPEQLVFRGFHIIDLNGYASTTDKAISFRSINTLEDTTSYAYTHYTARFEIYNLSEFANVSPDFVPQLAIEVQDLPDTVGGLLTLINNLINQYGCEAQLENGNIVVYGPVVTDPTLAYKSYIEASEVDKTAPGNYTYGGLFSDLIIAADSTAVFEIPVEGYAYPKNFITQPLIECRQQTLQETRYNVSRLSRRIVFESQTTAFWNANTSDRVMDYDTQRSSFDLINILQANVNCNRSAVLQRNWNYNILGIEKIDSGLNSGLADVHRVSIISTDENADNVPDNLDVYDANTYRGVADIINPKLHVRATPNNSSSLITLPVQYITGFGDISVINEDTGEVLNGPIFKTADGSLYSEFGSQHPARLLWQQPVDRIVADINNLPVVQTTVENGVVATLPPVFTTEGQVGDRYYVYTTNTMYEAVVTEIDPISGQEFITEFDTGTQIIPGQNATIGQIGYRYLSLSDNKIYTVVSIITDPNGNGQGPYSIVTMLDSGIAPELNWAVYVNDETEADRVWEYSGVEWTPTTEPGNGLSWFETTATGDRLSYGQPSNTIQIVSHPTDATSYNLLIVVNEYVYFHRPSPSDDWLPLESTTENVLNYVDDYLTHNYNVIKPDEQSAPGTLEEVYTAPSSVRQQYEFNRLFKRHMGRDKLNFNWMHFSPRYELVDPSPTNIIDMFIITRGYFVSFKRWLEDPLALPPDEPTPLSLRNDYGKLLNNKMFSDAVVLHPGKIKLVFGPKSAAALQARFKVIRSASSTMTDNQIKNVIVATTRNFFNIATFEFGETFFFTELSAAIHMDLSTEISSVVLVPTLQNSQFGDLLQVFAREDEIIYPDINVSDIDIVSGFTPTNIRMNG